MFGWDRSDVSALGVYGAYFVLWVYLNLSEVVGGEAEMYSNGV